MHEEGEIDGGVKDEKVVVVAGEDEKEKDSVGLIKGLRPGLPSPVLPRVEPSQAVTATRRNTLTLIDLSLDTKHCGLPHVRISPVQHVRISPIRPRAKYVQGRDH
jgi:hypothetical protein